MLYKSELAVDGTASHKLGGLDFDIFGGLVGRVGLHAAHGHQTGEARGDLFAVGLRVQVAPGPAAHVPGAVEGTVSARVWGRIF